MPPSACRTLVAVLLVCSSACGGTSSSTTSRYVGGTVVTSLAGSLTLDVAGANAFLASGPAGVVDATGTWTAGGSTVNLVGTYAGDSRLANLATTRAGVTYGFTNDPVAAPGDEVTGGIFTGGSPGAWVAYKAGGGRSVNVLCGSGSGASMLGASLVLGSDGQASMVMVLQTVPAVMEMTRTGASLSGTMYGYTFSGTVTASGQNASGTLTNGTSSGTWTVGVSGC
jgi:hypothetical protein